MCLITKQKEPIILKEDKVVYKALTKDHRSPVQLFKYRLNKLYSTSISTTHRFIFADSVSYEKYDEFRKNNEHWRSELIAIDLGMHSMVTIKRAIEYAEDEDNNGLSCGKLYVYQCTIPVGSEYYEDETGLCVSNQIIINKRIEL